MCTPSPNANRRAPTPCPPSVITQPDDLNRSDRPRAYHTPHEKRGKMTPIREPRGRCCRNCPNSSPPGARPPFITEATLSLSHAPQRMRHASGDCDTRFPAEPQHHPALARPTEARSRLVQRAPRMDRRTSQHHRRHRGSQVSRLAATRRKESVHDRTPLPLQAHRENGVLQAERGGFEPPMTRRPYRISNPARSTAPPPLRCVRDLSYAV